MRCCCSSTKNKCKKTLAPNWATAAVAGAATAGYSGTYTCSLHPVHPVDTWPLSLPPHICCCHASRLVVAACAVNVAAWQHVHCCLMHFGRASCHTATHRLWTLTIQLAGNRVLLDVVIQFISGLGGGADPPSRKNFCQQTSAKAQLHLLAGFMIPSLVSTAWLQEQSSLLFRRTHQHSRMSCCSASEA
jgi:hypothetical protein